VPSDDAEFGAPTNNSNAPHGVLGHAAEAPVETARVCWTPNENLNSVEGVAAALKLEHLEVLADGDKPLPDGWDMA